MTTPEGDAKTHVYARADNNAWMYRPAPRLPLTPRDARFLHTASVRYHIASKYARFKMNYCTMNYCVRRLITEIEARPTIWDSRIKEYSDRALKREAWEELCASFVPNYYESSDAERNGIVATMQRKWKSVRDAFLRELKKSANPIAGTKFTKPYAYYDNLSFLKPVCEVRSRRDDDEPIFNNETVTFEYDTRNKDDSDDDNNSRSSATFTENKALSAQPKRKRTKEKEDTEDSVFNMLAEHIKNKRKKDGREDPDRQFLLSLLPDLQSMDPNIKFDLKYEIMTVVKRYRDENLKFVAANYQE